MTSARGLQFIKFHVLAQQEIMIVQTLRQQTCACSSDLFLALYSCIAFMVLVYQRHCSCFMMKIFDEFQNHFLIIT